MSKSNLPEVKKLIRALIMRELKDSRRGLAEAERYLSDTNLQMYVESVTTAQDALAYFEMMAGISEC
jgi:hypothetical protein